MALIKKIIKKGDSYSITIDKDLIDLLGFDPDAPFELTVTNGKSLLVSQGKSKISGWLCVQRRLVYSAGDKPAGIKVGIP